MKSKEVLKLLKRTIEKWGERSQLEMLQEEATELALAARKHIRKQDDITWQDLMEEIADVEIMIEQVKIMFTSAQITVNVFKDHKLSRLEKRINENKFED